MADIEKVMQALKCCLPDTEEEIELGCKECPYDEECLPCEEESIALPLPLVTDIKELLKEQESIIEVLKSDLSETLDVVANRGNVVRCKDCKHSEHWYG